MLYVILNQKPPRTYGYHRWLIHGKDSIVFILEGDTSYEIPKELEIFDVTLINVQTMSFDMIEPIIQDLLLRNNFTPKEVRLVCTQERLLLVASRLRDKFEIPGTSGNVMRLFRDKLAMKARLMTAGVRVPKALLMGSYSFEFLTRELGSPFVAKPIFGMGSQGTKIVLNCEQLEMIRSTSNPEHYECEEFITGSMGHCDSIVNSGRIMFAEACHYPSPPLDFLSGRPTGALLMLESEEIRRRVLALNEHVLEILEADQCVTHLEFFITHSGQVIFLEVAARPAGGGIVPMYEKIFGLNLWEIATHLQMRPETLDIKSYKIHKYAGFACFPRPEGIVRKISWPEIRSRVVSKSCAINVGEHSTSSMSSTDNAACIFFESDCYEDVRKDFEELRDFRIFNRIEP